MSINKVQQVYEHIEPFIEKWPVAVVSRERAEFIKELNAFVLNRILESYGENLHELISKTVFMENQRIKASPWKVDPADEKMYWSNISSELDAALLREDRNEVELALLKRIINRYSEEIVGTFDPKIFRFSRIFLTSFFKRIFNRYFSPGKWRWGKKEDLQKKIKLVGDIAKIRQLFSKGTVVVLPTHYSNLDSIMVGYAIDTNVGLPHFSFGAGLNLFNVEIVAYFMNRLGAYRVDRRKKNPIYLECLKSMASYSLLKGVNNIFFPGGTRSRSGATEEKLKLGLISSLIEAQRLLLLEKSDKKIFVVPLNIGYHFVLEAGILVEQHLQSIGREKYIRPPYQSWTFQSIIKLVKSLYTKESEVYMSFGEPMDVLGNRVDAEGKSYDKFGHAVDLGDYFKLGDEFNSNQQRESIYSKLLGDAVVAAYKKNNVVLSSNIAAFVAWQLYYNEHEDIDLHTLLNTSLIPVQIPKDLFYRVCDEVILNLRERASRHEITIAPEIQNESTEQIVLHGLKNLGIYHPKKVLKWNKDDTLTSESTKLLYFYHHRLQHYNLESIVKETVKNFATT